MDWNRLPLARATVDRAAHLRTRPDLLAELWADASTRVVVVADGRLATTVDDEGSLLLDIRTPSALPGLDPLGAAGRAAAGLLLFLGRAEAPAHADASAHADAAPAAYLALVLADVPTGVVGIEGVAGPAPFDGTTWATLREVGHTLSDHDAGLATVAVALAGWHARHPRCPRCGAPTLSEESGWVRRCPADGGLEYPRTDAAVIMAVVDAEDRLLLGHAAHWPDRRFSTLAGYVEPGESVESAVRREVAEEVGVVVTDVTYRASQPWPFPASLMLAYTATAVTTDIVVDGVELTEARWFTRTELAHEVAAGEVLLPMQTSVALALIEDWFGGPVGGDSAREAGGDLGQRRVGRG